MIGVGVLPLFPRIDPAGLRPLQGMNSGQLTDSHGEHGRHRVSCFDVGCPWSGGSLRKEQGLVETIRLAVRAIVALFASGPASGGVYRDQISAEPREASAGLVRCSR